MQEIYFSITGMPGRHFYNFNFLPAGTLRKFISLSLTLLLLFCINTIYAQGPGAAWEYSRPLSLSTATPLANFQVKVTLSTGQYTNIKADGSDLRFYDNSNASCSYWIEKWDNAATSVIWVKVTTSGASSLTMYYGNPSATIAANGNNTFDFFDDFAGNSLSANWVSNVTGGTTTVAGGQVTLNNTSTGTVSISSAFTSVSPSFIIEVKHKKGLIIAIGFTQQMVPIAVAPSDGIMDILMPDQEHKVPQKFFGMDTREPNFQLIQII
jgi:hypothetical protein